MLAPGTDALDEAILAVMENGRAVSDALADAQTAATADIDAAAASAPTPVANLTVVDAMQTALDAGAVVIEFGAGSGGMGMFSQQTYQNLVDGFQALHPDIVVEVKASEGFRGSMSLAEMAAEYDCFRGQPQLF